MLGTVLSVVAARQHPLKVFVVPFRAFFLAAGVVASSMAPSSVSADPTPYPIAYSGPASRSVVYVSTSNGWCSGAVLSGSRAVLTAAHCVVSRGSVVAKITVWAEGAKVSPYAVSVRTDWTKPAAWCSVLGTGPCTSTNADFAVMWFESPLANPGLSFSSCRPAQRCDEKAPAGSVLLGYQLTGSNGVMLRSPARGAGLLPPLQVIADPENTAATKPYSIRLAGCTIPAQHTTRFSNNTIGVRCGLIQGASGGALISSGPVPRILGLTSGVYDNGLRNLVVPAATLRAAVWGDIDLLDVVYLR